MYKQNYFNPLFVFFSGLFFFYIIPMVYYSDYNLISFSVLIFGCFSYLLGYYGVGGLKIKLKPRNVILNKYLVFFSFSIFLYVIIKRILASSFIDYNELFANRSEVEIYLSALSYIYDIYFLLFFSYFCAKSRVKFFIVLILYIIYGLTFSTRFYLVSYMIYWIAFATYCGFFRINFFHALISVFLLPFIFIILLLKRGYSGTSFIDYVITLVSSGDFFKNTDLILMSLESFQSYITMKSIIVDNFIHIDSGVLRIFFMIIPRSLWSDKPESVSRIVAHEYYLNAYNSGGGMVGGIFGDSYVNGGYLAIIIIWFIVGCLSKIVYNTTIKDINKIDSNSIFLIVLYLIFILSFILILRGFLSDYIYTFAIKFFLLFFINKLLSNKIILK